MPPSSSTSTPLTPHSGDSMRINDILAALQNGVTAINNFGKTTLGGVQSTAVILSSIGSSQLLPGTGSSGQFLTIQSGTTPIWASSAELTGPITIDSTLFLSGYTAGHLWTGAAGTVVTDKIGVVSPGLDGVVGNGTTDDSAAIATIIANNTETHILPGTYALNTALTPGSSKVIIFQAGAVFKSTASITMDFSGSDVYAPIAQQCFALTLNHSSVIGLDDVTPEMFGAKRDGATADNVPINIAFRSIIGGTAHHRRPTMRFLSGTYFIAAPVIADMTGTPSGVYSLSILGAGVMEGQTTSPTGTKIFCSSQITNPQAFLVTGATGGTYDLLIKDFFLQNAFAGSGPAQGFVLGRGSSFTGSSAGQINGISMGGILVENVYVSGFAKNFTLQNARNTTWRGIASWPFDGTGGNTSGSIGIWITCTGNSAAVFSGDTDFDHCQVQEDTSATCNSVQIYDQGNICGFGGIRFNHCDFYTNSGNNGNSICFNLTLVGSASFCQDLWIQGGSQFENQTSGAPGYAFQASATSGARIEDIHILDNYIDGFGFSNPILLQINDNLSICRNVYIEGNFILNPFNIGINVQGVNNGGGSNGYTIVGNTFFVGGGGTNDLGVFNNLVGEVVVSGNNCMTSPGSTTTPTNGFAFTGVGSRAVVIGNNTRAVTPVFVSSQWTNVIGSTLNI